MRWSTIERRLFWGAISGGRARYHSVRKPAPAKQVHTNTAFLKNGLVRYRTTNSLKTKAGRQSVTSYEYETIDEYNMREFNKQSVGIFSLCSLTAFLAFFSISTHMFVFATAFILAGSLIALLSVAATITDRRYGETFFKRLDEVICSGMLATLLSICIVVALHFIFTHN